MGIQSQRRLNQTQRTKALAQRHNHKRGWKSKYQLTLWGEEAFERLRHCKVCVAKEKKKIDSKVSIPHRSHHPCCKFNRHTRGYTNIEYANAERAAEALHKRNTAPLQPHEQLTVRPREEDFQVFFRDRHQEMPVVPPVAEMEVEPAPPTATIPTATVTENQTVVTNSRAPAKKFVSVKDMYTGVVSRLSEPGNHNKSAPSRCRRSLMK